MLNQIDKLHERLNKIPEVNGRVYPAVIPANSRTYPMITYGLSGGSNYPSIFRGLAQRLLVRISVVGEEQHYRQIIKVMESILLELQATPTLLFVDPDPPVDSYNETIDAIEQTIFVTLR